MYRRLVLRLGQRWWRGRLVPRMWWGVEGVPWADLQSSFWAQGVRQNAFILGTVEQADRQALVGSVYQVTV